MTDMRATERLLEVLSDQILLLDAGGPDERQVRLMNLMDIITELRRRGDTLVRAADLRIVLATALGSTEYDEVGDARFSEASDRLENALGGRMR